MLQTLLQASDQVIRCVVVRPIIPIVDFGALRRVVVARGCGRGVRDKVAVKLTS